MKSIFDIKNKPRLLARYGLCMILIAYLERLLLSFLSTKKNLSRNGTETLYKKTFGQLIKFSEGVIEENLREELKEVSEQRNILAHGVVIENKIFKKDKDCEGRGFTVSINFTLGELNKIIKKTKRLINKIIKMIKINIK